MLNEQQAHSFQQREAVSKERSQRTRKNNMHTSMHQDVPGSGWVHASRHALHAVQLVPEQQVAHEAMRTASAELLTLGGGL